MTLTLVNIPHYKVIDNALSVLKAAPVTAPPTTTATQQQASNGQVSDNTAFCRKQAWLVIQVSYDMVCTVDYEKLKKFECKLNCVISVSDMILHPNKLSLDFSRSW